MPYSTKEREALNQQAIVFQMATDIMAQRTEAYGLTWQQYGALANLLNAARKVDRLMSIWWRGDEDDVPRLDKSLLDDAYDAVNYLGFFIQLATSGNLIGSQPEHARIQKSLCDTCNGPIWWQESPTGGWWIHVAHPLDEHDATPINEGC